MFKQFLKNLEIWLVNCETDLILAWSNRYLVIDNYFVNQVAIFAITDTKRYVPLAA